MNDKFSVELSQVPLSDEAWVRAALPDGCFIKRPTNKGFMIVDGTDHIVAWAKVENGKVLFDLCENGYGSVEWLYAKLVKKFPQSN